MAGEGDGTGDVSRPAAGQTHWSRRERSRPGLTSGSLQHIKHYLSQETRQDHRGRTDRPPCWMNSTIKLKRRKSKRRRDGNPSIRRPGTHELLNCRRGCPGRGAGSATGAGSEQQCGRKPNESTEKTRGKTWRQR